MAKFTVKADAGIVSHNMTDYVGGDVIEMSKDAALKISHALVEGEDLKAGIFKSFEKKSEKEVEKKKAEDEAEANRKAGW